MNFDVDKLFKEGLFHFFKIGYRGCRELIISPLLLSSRLQGKPFRFMTSYFGYSNITWMKVLAKLEGFSIPSHALMGGILNFVKQECSSLLVYTKHLDRHIIVLSV